jgi:hypothetical protein
MNRILVRCHSTKTVTQHPISRINQIAYSTPANSPQIKNKYPTPIPLPTPTNAPSRQCKCNAMTDIFITFTLYTRVVIHNRLIYNAIIARPRECVHWHLCACYANLFINLCLLLFIVYLCTSANAFLNTLLSMSR